MSEEFTIITAAFKNKRPNGYWTLRRILVESRQFETRLEFQKYSSSAYQSAKSQGILEQVCGHMTDLLHRDWTIESLTNEASQYSTLKAFREKSSSAYRHAQGNGIIGQICGHMKRAQKPNGYWTEPLIAEEAKRHTEFLTFYRHSSGAYDAAKKLGIIDSVCGHLSRGTTGFKRSMAGTLYYLRVNTGNSNLFKIGITNNSVSDRFPRTDDRSKIETLATYQFPSGKDAQEAELKVLRAFREFQYNGPDILIGGGNRELFTKNVLGIIKPIGDFSGDQFFKHNIGIGCQK